MRIMKVTEIELKTHLDKLCGSNWKAEAIMKANDNDFMSLPDYQQEMFMKAMGINEVTYSIRYNHGET